MTKNDTDFETWYDNLCMNVLDLSGIEFNDPDSVRDDYENGANLFDVAESIADEYNS